MKSQKQPRRRFFSWKKSVLLVFTVLVIGIVVFGWQDFFKGRAFSREHLQFPIIFTDRFGREIHRSFKNENRVWIPLEKISPFLRDATVIAEDRRFYYHFGADIIGIVRAAAQNIRNRSLLQGASTLTQQIARKTFLTDEKTVSRKLREIFLAMGIESSHTKQEVLEMYLNVVPYGPTANGVDVAAEQYFDKSPAELSEAEALVLAMLPQDPVRLSRNRHVRRWLGICSTLEENCNLFTESYHKSRIEAVLLAMADKHGWPNEKTVAIHESLKTIVLPKAKNWAHTDFQHFRFFVGATLQKQGFDPGKTEGSIIVRTSLDKDLQDRIYALLREKMTPLTEKYGMGNSALLILDNITHQPVVWIGSKSFWQEDISGQVDMLRARRQSGSAIKPFIYAAAITAGFEPPTIFYDSEFRFLDYDKVVYNADGKFLGPIRMTDALAKSRNIPAIKALFLAGGENKVREYMTDIFGFDIDDAFPNQSFGWSLALGTAPIAPGNLANAYATLATGEKRELCPIISITAAGKNIGNPCDLASRITLPESTVFFLGEILSNIEARPNGNWRKNLTVNDYNVAVKTGTSTVRISKRLYPVDNLIVGYTPKTTFLLWGGNTDGTPLAEDSSAVFALGELWNEIVQTYYAKYPDTYAEFTPPAEIERVRDEWATVDYSPPPYDALKKYIRYNPELGINPSRSLVKEQTE